MKWLLMLNVYTVLLLTNFQSPVLSTRPVLKQRRPEGGFLRKLSDSYGRNSYNQYDPNELDYYSSDKKYGYDEDEYANRPSVGTYAKPKYGSDDDYNYKKKYDDDYSYKKKYDYDKKDSQKKGIMINNSNRNLNHETANNKNNNVKIEENNIIQITMRLGSVENSVQAMLNRINTLEAKIDSVQRLSLNNII